MRGLLDIRTESFDGTVALTIAGRADAEAADRLRETLGSLDPAPGQRLLLRLQDLHSCDTPAAFELLELVREAKDRGADVQLEGRPGTVVSTILMLADVRDDLGLRPLADGPSNGATNRSS